jgi:hypothetical protein
MMFTKQRQKRVKGYDVERGGLLTIVKMGEGMRKVE